MWWEPEQEGACRPPRAALRVAHSHHARLSRYSPPDLTTTRSPSSATLGREVGIDYPPVAREDALASRLLLKLCLLARCLLPKPRLLGTRYIGGVRL